MKSDDYLDRREYLNKMLLEYYFDRGIILTRFTTFEDLREKMNKRLESYGLKINDYDMKAYFDNSYEDYSVTVAIYEDDKLKYDLQLYYAITRIGERIIVESNFEKY